MAVPKFIEPPRVPPLFRCPISLELMKDPVTLSTGQTYDRSSIEKWFESGHSFCPATMQQVTGTDLIPNHTLRRLIQDWCVANRSKGVERIPTPKQPVQLNQVKELLQRVSHGGRAVRSLRQVTRESEGNRRLVAEAGAAPVLVELLSSSNSASNLDACEDAVATLVLLLPLVSESAKKSFVTSQLLSVLAWLLNRSSCEVKINTAMLLESLAIDDELKSQIGATESLMTGLVKLLREDLYQRAVRSSLLALLSIVSCKKNRVRAVDSGAVAPLVELLPQASAHNTERALGILEQLARCPEGRAQMVQHALCVPVVVRIILTVSDVASEKAVEILWLLCKADDTVVHVAAQEGAFTQMLLLIQADNSLHTSSLARELLKLLTTSVPQECFHDFAFTMPF